VIKEKERDDQTELEEDETAFMKRENNYMFSFKQRREHYKKKITSLDHRIKELDNDRMDIENIRARYTIKMRSNEKKVLEIKLELEKLSHYTADTITSTVLNGFNMQYKTNDFRIRIDKIYKTLFKEIAEMKLIIVNNENRRNLIKLKIEDLHVKRKDRLAKYLEFEHLFQKKLKMFSKISSLLTSVKTDMMLYQQYFEKFREYSEEVKELKASIVELFMNQIKRYVHVCIYMIDRLID